MQTISHVLRIVDRRSYLSRRRLRYWADRVFTRQKIAEIAIVASTLTIIGVVLLCLDRAIQDCTITGPLPY
jgi:hypothetical protein